MTRFYFQPWQDYHPTWHYRIRPSTYVIGGAIWIAVMAVVTGIAGLL